MIVRRLAHVVPSGLLFIVMVTVYAEHGQEVWVVLWRRVGFLREGWVEDERVCCGANVRPFEGVENRPPVRSRLQAAKPQQGRQR